jgi:uncharacterized protein (DUF2141 family)
MRYLPLLLALIATPAAAEPGKVEVVLIGVEARGGKVLVALFDEKTFWRAMPPFTVELDPPADGTLRATFANVPAGDYVVNAIHDENGDLKLDMGAGGIPSEGYSLSRGEALRAAPTFATLKVTVPADGARFEQKMVYPKKP